MEIKKVIKRLIEKHGSDEIELSWEGGNDEGSYYLSIGGKDVDFYENRKSDAYELVDFIADKLGYYGFAGDFSCNGSVTYNSEAGVFEGDDTYEENEERASECDIKIRVPEYLWFDRITIDVSGCGESVDTNFKFFISNGPVFEELVDLENKFDEFISKEIYKILEEKTCVSEVNSVYLDVDISREDMLRDSNGNLVLTIKEFTYYEYEANDKTISIPIS